MTGFDPAWYLDRYPDLRAAGLNTFEAAERHWNRYGRTEDRFPNAVAEASAMRPVSHEPELDPAWYLDRYPDLRNAGIATPDAAARHWRACGCVEGRFPNERAERGAFAMRNPEPSDPAGHPERCADLGTAGTSVSAAVGWRRHESDREEGRFSDAETEEPVRRKQQQQRRRESASHRGAPSVPRFPLDRPPEDMQKCVGNPAPRELQLVFVSETRADREYGGLGDRVLGLVSCRIFARAVGRRFLLWWKSPDVSSALTVGPEFDYASVRCDPSATTACLTLPTSGNPGEDAATLARLRMTDWEKAWRAIDTVFVWSNMCFQYALYANPFVQRSGRLYGHDCRAATLESYRMLFSEILVPVPAVLASVDSRYLAMKRGDAGSDPDPDVERREGGEGGAENESGCRNEEGLGRADEGRERGNGGSTDDTPGTDTASADERKRDGATASTSVARRPFLAVGVHMRFGDKHIRTVDRARWAHSLPGDPDVASAARGCFARILPIVLDAIRRRGVPGARVFIASDCDADSLARIFRSQRPASVDVDAVCVPGQILHLDRSAALREGIDAAAVSDLDREAIGDGIRKMVADLLLLSRCDVIITQRQSNFGRVASLAAAGGPDVERWFTGDREGVPYFSATDVPRRIDDIATLFPRLAAWVV